MNLKSIWAVIPLILGLPLALSEKVEAAPQVVTDTSDDGTVTDANGNGNPDEAGENDKTPIKYQIITAIGISENAAQAVSNGDGTHHTTLVLVVKNIGNVTLSGVQMVNDFTSQFPAGVTFSISDMNTLTNSGYQPLSLNPNFNGDSDSNVLDGTDTLAPGQQGAVFFKLTFNPGTNPSPLQNQTIAKGSYLTIQAEDKSDFGTAPDPNNNGDAGEAGENDPTPLAFKGTPLIGVSKTASTAVSNGDGSFTTVFTIFVENMGQVPLTSLRIYDALAGNWVAANPVVSNVTSSDFSVNPNYDGTSNAEVLDQTDTLGLGESGSVQFTVTFTPTGQPLTNQVVASAKGNGVTTKDRSTVGKDPDPNDDGSPSEQEPTPVTWKATPVVGLAKSATEAVAMGNGAFKSSITFKVENLGDIALTQIQVEDDLRSIFPNNMAYSVSNLQAVGLSKNTAFDGDADQKLLVQNTVVLPAGGSASITFDVTFVPNGNAGPFLNSAKVRAQEVGQ